jgi:zinc protease
VNSLVAQFSKVTPELLQKTAEEYLRPTNRTIIELQPASRDAGAPANKQ